MSYFDPILTWVHLSDIHLGHGGAEHRYDQRLVLDKLAEDIGSLASREDIPPLDTVIVTGDIAFSGGVRDEQEYANAGQWLRGVAESNSIEPNRVFVIPGNHDVQRSAEETNNSVRRLLSELRLGNESIDDALDDDGESGDLALLKMRLSNYLDFAKEFAPEVDLGLHGEAALFWLHKISVRDNLTVRLVGLNSALLCAKEPDEHGDERRLQIGRKQMVDSFISTSIDYGREIIVALSHHPFNWLRDSNYVLQTVKGYAHVHLCGHIHEAESQYMRSGAGEELVTVVSGAAHGEPVSAPARAQHGYNIGSLGIRDGESLVLRVWPRIWSSSHDFRMDVSNVRQNDDGGRPYREDYAEHELGFDIPGTLISTGTAPEGPGPTTPRSPGKSGPTKSQDDRFEQLEPEARRGGPESAMVLFNQANALYNVGRLQDAVKTYRQAVDLDPNFHEALLNMGNALYKLTQYADADEAFQQAEKSRIEAADAARNASSSSNYVTVLDNLNRQVERLVKLPANEFINQMSFAVEGWWRDNQLGHRTREMQRRYDEVRAEFRGASELLRPPLIELKEALLAAHPEVHDDAEIGKSIIESMRHHELDLSLDRFDQLAQGAPLRGAELPQDTAYNSLADRDVWTEEPTPERQMLVIINARLDRLWLRRKAGGPPVGAVQEQYVGLDIQHNIALQRFVEWKKGTPEGAMRELLAISKALNRNIPEEVEPQLDVQSWTVSLFWIQVSEDWPETARYQRLVELYKQLLERAAEGLRLLSQ